MKAPIFGKGERLAGLQGVNLKPGNDQIVHTVASADVARQFGRIRLLPDGQDVFVTHHGRITHVLTTINAYAALTDSSGKGPEIPLTPMLRELANCMHYGIILIDYELSIISINLVIEAWFGCKSTECLGQSLFEAIPTLWDSFVRIHIQRSVTSKQPCSVDVPNLPANGAWVCVQTYPLGKYVAILFNDISNDVKLNRLADANQSLYEAVLEHDAISYVLLNASGLIVEINPTFHNLVNLTGSRLQQVAFTSLIPNERRVTFEEALKLVLRGEGARTIDSALLCNGGRDVPVKMAISELPGAVNPESVLIILTRM